MKIIYLNLIFCLCCCSISMAGTNHDMERQIQLLMEQNRKLAAENRELAKRLENVEKKLTNIQPEQEMTSGAEIKDSGNEAPPWYEHITIDGGMTGIVQGTANNGKNNPEGGDHTDAAYTFDLGIHADLDGYGKMHLHLEGGDGEGLNNNVPSFSAPNYDSYATLNNSNLADLTISEAHYENAFLDEMVMFNMGKMDLSVLFDENNVAGDETTQFLSNIFVKSMGVLIPEPDEFYCPTVMLGLTPTEFFDMKLIGASVDQEDKHVWEDVFSNGFLAGQINFRPQIAGRQGNYRFYGWYDSREYLDNKYLANPSESNGYDHRSGFGLSFDQEIIDALSVFARYSWSNDDVSTWDSDNSAWEMVPINQMYTLGLGLGGSFWNRPYDTAGLGFGQTILTDDFEKAHQNTSNEKYIETYYRFYFNRYLALSADFQWIQNPGGLSDNDDVYIFGMRSQIDF